MDGYDDDDSTPIEYIRHFNIPHNFTIFKTLFNASVSMRHILLSVFMQN